jgi:hypothetical protein
MTLTPETVNAFSTVTAGVVMLYLANRKRMIEPRGTKARCPACGKLYRRGGVCRCVRR